MAWDRVKGRDVTWDDCEPICSSRAAKFQPLHDCWWEFRRQPDGTIQYYPNDSLDSLDSEDNGWYLTKPGREPKETPTCYDFAVKWWEWAQDKAAWQAAKVAGIVK